MQRHPTIEVLDSAVHLRGRIFDVIEETVRLPSGLVQNLLIVDHPGAVCIAPVFPGGDLLVVRQYRHAIGDWLIELPAGCLLQGEDPLVGARRELEEETGYQAQEWRELRRFHPGPGFTSERIVLFEARGLELLPQGGRACDEDEELETLRMSPAELLSGRTTDGKTLLAASLLLAAASG